MSYLRPTATVEVSASWRDHLDRDPPSSEPGTDYPCPYGSPVVAVDAGIVTYVKTTNSTATGRVVEYRLNDGRTTRSLHLDDVLAWVGMNVGRGQVIAHSGASGFGSDWGYGPHLHQTLWPAAAWRAPTIDFELYVGDPPPPPPPPPEEEDDMAKNSGFIYTRSDGVVICGMLNLDSGAFSEWQDGGGTYNSGVAVGFDMPTFAPITESHRNNLAQMCADVRAQKANGAPAGTTSKLVTPAWIGGVFLGLIGLVELVRFIVEVVT